MSSLRGMAGAVRASRKQAGHAAAVPSLGEEPGRVPHDPNSEVRELWRRRLGQTLVDSYAGVPLTKFPEDLRLYEHLLWAGRIDAVIELGAGAGGSALWFRDRLRTFREHGRCRGSAVVSVDIDLARARENVRARERDITFIEADVRDPALPDRVAGALPRGARCLVVEDGPHTYEATFAALAGFARLVPPDGWFVVEDGVVDEEELRIRDDWPRGVQRAVSDWLESPAGAAFTLRRDVEVYGLTTNPGGYLHRDGGAHATSSR